MRVTVDQRLRDAICCRDWWSLLLRSRLCGKHYRGKKARSQRQSYSYYRCCGGDAYRFGGQRMCSNRAVRSDRLDAAVWEDVSALLLEPGRVDTEYRRRLENEARPADNDREALLLGSKGSSGGLHAWWRCTRMNSWTGRLSDRGCSQRNPG